MSYESTIPTYMLYFCAVLIVCVFANSNFYKEFPFLCPYHSWSDSGWPIFFHARFVILKMSVYSLVIAQECGGNRDTQSRNEKEIYFMLSNNKFLGKCWYGRHPCIRLAMDCERMVEKAINFILCLGTTYYVSSTKSIGNSRSFSLTGKACLSKQFYVSI